MELYHIENNAAENNYEIKVLVSVKTRSSFLNYVSSMSLDFIALKASSSERRRIILLLSLEDAFKAMKSRLVELT